MLKSTLKFSIIILLSTTLTHTQTAHTNDIFNQKTQILYVVEKNKQPEYKPFINKYGLSLATGASIGALSGWGCSAFETKMFGQNAGIPCKLLCFLIFNSITISGLNIITEGFDEKNIEYDKKALYSSQWLINWIAYLTS